MHKNYELQLQIRRYVQKQEIKSGALIAALKFSVQDKPPVVSFTERHTRIQTQAHQRQDTSIPHRG